MFVKKTLLVYMVLEDTLMKHIKEKSRFVASFVTKNTHILINLSNTIKHLTNKTNHMNVKFVKSLLIMELLLSSTREMSIKWSKKKSVNVTLVIIHLTPSTFLKSTRMNKVISMRQMQEDIPLEKRARKTH